MFIGIHKLDIEEYLQKNDNTYCSCIIGRSKGGVRRGILQRGGDPRDFVLIYVDDPESLQTETQEYKGEEVL